MKTSETSQAFLSEEFRGVEEETEVNDYVFRKAEFIGELAAVYNFPFASLSLYGNYLSYPARKQITSSLNGKLNFYSFPRRRSRLSEDTSIVQSIHISSVNFNYSHVSIRMMYNVLI